MLDTLISYGSAVRGLTWCGLSWLEWVGLLLTLFIAIYQIPLLTMAFYTTWIGPMLGHYTDLRKMGKWALVTGASDGIGKAYAQELGRLGLNVVLISRSRDKLQNVANEIEKDFNVQTKVIVVDFTHGPSVYEEIKKEIENLEIGTLVNNIGMSYPHPSIEYFMDLPRGDQYCVDLINCNVVPMTMMSRLLLPQMIQRKAGVIINIVSFSPLPAAFPLMSAYAATKAYVDRLSQSLAYEYEKQGIVIQTLLPALVATKLAGISKPSWTCPTPTEYVQQALKTVGLQHRTAVHLSHRLAMKAMEWFAFYAPNITTEFLIYGALKLKSLTLASKENANNITTEDRICNPKSEDKIN